MNRNEQLEQALIECIPHLRDVSVRDGVQSWDGNKWPIGAVLNVVDKIQAYAALVQEFGGKIAPVEVWGGGQVAQPAIFLGEDPLINMEEIHRRAPSIEPQCLYRGRQGFGFVPIARDVQLAALKAAVERGIKVVRIFDMMNDPSNVKPGIDILKQLQSEGHKVTIEGAISYINAAANGKRAMTFEDYGDYAVELAKQGCNEIAIKDYAGVGTRKDIIPLIDSIKNHLNKAGYGHLKLNLHSHGQKPELLVEALKHGVDKVDVAFGDLSGGPAHTNMIDVLKLMLKEKGFAVEGTDKILFDGNPLIKKIAEIEAVIKEETDKIRQDGKSLREGRIPPRSQEQIESYHMAGGALADMWGRMKPEEFEGYKKMWRAKRERFMPEGTGKAATNYTPAIPPFDHVPETKDEWYTMALETGALLWEKAGCFNTVTPGAKIITDQVLSDPSSPKSVPLLEKRITGEPILMTDYNDSYLNAILGRYGENKGLDAGRVGDLEFRKAVQLFKALKKINDLVSQGEMNAQNAKHFFNIACKVVHDSHHNPFIFAGGTLNLAEPTLEARLKKADITQFETRLEELLPADIAGQIKSVMHIGKSPEPNIGMKEGLARVEQFKGEGIDVKAMSEAGKRISYGSEGRDAALLIRLLDEGAGSKRDIAANLFRRVANSNVQAAAQPLLARFQPPTGSHIPQPGSGQAPGLP